MATHPGLLLARKLNTDEPLYVSYRDGEWAGVVGMREKAPALPPIHVAATPKSKFLAHRCASN
jgi:hypothetical protein